MSVPTLKGDLKPEIKTELEAFFGTPNNPTKLDEFCDALAGSIAAKVIAHIQANAVVTVTVSGVQSGGSTAGGTGTVA
jgi:hypothetical protein